MLRWVFLYYIRFRGSFDTILHDIYPSTNNDCNLSGVNRGVCQLQRTVYRQLQHGHLVSRLLQSFDLHISYAFDWYQSFVRARTLLHNDPDSHNDNDNHNNHYRDHSDDDACHHYHLSSDSGRSLQHRHSWSRRYHK